MSRKPNLKESLHSGSADGFHIAFQQCLERLPGFPLRVFRRKLLHAIGGEKKLGIQRIFDPQGAVVIKGGDALLGRDIVLAALFHH